MDQADESGASPADGPPAHRSKVGRVIQEYGLDGLGDVLERRWLGDDGDRHSLRQLAEFYNRQVLEAAIDAADGRLIDGEVENLYRLLTGDDVTSRARTQAETKLSRMGVDAESLQNDFVTHQAVHTYLTKFRGVSAPTTYDSPGEAIENRRETIQRLRNRLSAVTDRSLDGLREAGHVSVGAPDVMVSVTVHCHECDTTYDIVDVLDRGRCDCKTSGD